MGQPKAWFWGLLPLALVLLCVIYFRQGDVEADITARSRAALPAELREWAHLHITGRDGVLTGISPSLEAQKAAPDELGKVFGLRKVTDGTTLLAEKSPFIFTATLEAGALSLTGVAPPGAPLAGLNMAAKAALPSATLTSKVEAARGFPAGNWQGASAALFKAMGMLTKGAATLNGSVLSLTGTGQLGITEVEVREALKALPAGYSLDTLAIEPGVIKPYTFEALRGAGAITLSGFVPNAAMRNSLVTFIKSLFEHEMVEDKLVEGPGAPAGFEASLKAALLHLARLAPGAKLSLVDTVLTVKGDALHPAARDDITAKFKPSLPQGFNAALELGIAPIGAPIRLSPECQKLYSDALSMHVIRFRSGASEITAESYPLLDRLAVITLRCDEAQVEISGHTDSDGAPEANAELSSRRAEAVVSFMALAGVPQSRMDVIGYGETRPVAPNDTPQNKAKNRRIDFTVK